MKIALIISDIELTSDGVLIKEALVIDRDTCKPIKKAEVNEHFIDLLRSLEIELNDYSKIQKLRIKNPAFNKLIDTFKLYT